MGARVAPSAGAAAALLVGLRVQPESVFEEVEQRLRLLPRGTVALHAYGHRAALWGAHEGIEGVDLGRPHFRRLVGASPTE